MDSPSEEALQVLRDLVTTIEATGGLVRDEGLLAPACDPEWIDLGETAYEAYGVLVKTDGHAKLTIHEREESEDEDG